MTGKVAKSSNRGSKPGERRGGRQKGTLNKATADIKAIAREYTTKAIETLIALVDREDSPATQLGAARELLDRAYGKPSQVVAGDPENPIAVQEVVRRIVDTNHRDSPRI